MELTIRPTDEFFHTGDGMRLRAWRGVTDTDNQVVALVAAVLTAFDSETPDPLTQERVDRVIAKQRLSANVTEMQELATLRSERATLHRALAFAASVIKSGEGWTATCESEIGGVLQAMRRG